MTTGLKQRRGQRKVAGFRYRGDGESRAQSPRVGGLCTCGRARVASDHSRVENNKRCGGNFDISPHRKPKLGELEESYITWRTRARAHARWMPTPESGGAPVAVSDAI